MVLRSRNGLKSFQGLFEAKNLKLEIEHLEFLIRSLSQPMSELHASLDFCATGMFTTSSGTYGIIMSWPRKKVIPDILWIQNYWWYFQNDCCGWTTVVFFENPGFKEIMRFPQIKFPRIMIRLIIMNFK